MSYLNHLKAKLEKQEENNSAAMHGDDLYIREVDEYSEETHSEDMFQKNAKSSTDIDKKTGRKNLN